MYSDIYDHNCTLCPLHEGAKTVCVEGSGRSQYRAMIVGEAPGRNEDERGTPFIGQAGFILDRVLKDVFISERARQETFVTNAVKCRPPGNRDPKFSEIRACVSAYLTREIELVDPYVILALGNPAAWALIGQTGITSLRGTWHRLDSERERWVLVTYHPAFILRQGLDSDAAEMFHDDLNMFANRAIANGHRHPDDGRDKY
jgi:uracil-DNA glycosylase family 4